MTTEKEQKCLKCFNMVQMLVDRAADSVALTLF